MTRENFPSQAESAEVKSPVNRFRSSVSQVLKTLGLAVGLTVGMNAVGSVASYKAHQIKHDRMEDERHFDLKTAQLIKVVDLDSPADNK